MTLTGTQPLQKMPIVKKLIISGDRTKHLKNLHGIHKPSEAQTGLHGDADSPQRVSQEAGPATMSTAEGPASSPEDIKPAIGLLAAALRKTTEVPASGAAATTAAAPLFTTTTGGVRRGGVGDMSSQSKFDPLDINLSTSSSCLPPSQDTVSMSLDEVLQYAQPIADFF
jgi:hypothetical protein